MAVIRLRYKRNGVSKKIQTWYIDLKDHQGIGRRFPGYTDKAATVRLESDVKVLVNALKAGLSIETTEARLALMGRDAKIKNSLIKFGLLDKASAPKTLEALVSEFCLTVPTGKTKSGGCNSRDTVDFRLRKIITDNGFGSFGDCTEDRLNLYFAEELDLSPQTQKAYLMVFRRFGKWLFKNGYAKTVPDLKAVKVPKKAERHFEKNEFARLLETVRTGPDRRGLTGAQRYLCYLTAVQTGLRAEELRSLTKASFDFDNNRVLVCVGETKNKDEAWQDLSVTLNSLLKEYTRNMLPNVRLFDLRLQKAALMIQEDCKAAGIEVEKFGKRIKFHSLRHTTASFLLADGNNMKIVQEIMRHSDISITVSRYGHLLKGQKKSAIAGLDSYCNIKAATGTD